MRSNASSRMAAHSRTWASVSWTRRIARGSVQELGQAAVDALVVPVPATMVATLVAARAVLVALLAADLPGGLPQLLLEVANGAADLVADLAGQAVHRAGDLGLELVQLVAAGRPARRGRRR